MEVIMILEKMFPDIDFEKEENLLEKGLIDSVDVVNIIANIEENFELEIPIEYINIENFSSAKNINKMIEVLKGE